MREEKHDALHRALEERSERRRKNVIKSRIMIMSCDGKEHKEE